MATALEPAEFYFLHDGRGEFKSPYSQTQLEADPRATTRLAREIARRRMAVDPRWTPYEILPPYFDLPDVEMDPELVLAATAFAAPRPPALPHHDLIRNPTEGQAGAWYEIVSAEWKAAIESLEPGVHQFFAHEFRFADGVVSDRFVVRCRTQVDNARSIYRVENILDVWSDVVGYKFFVDSTYSVPTLDRERVAGRHFVNCPARLANYFSRALAEKLLPLLPERVALLPVKVSGAAPAFPGGPPEVGGRSPEPPPPSPRDPELAAAIALVNNPLAAAARRQVQKARSTLESRLARGSVEQIFDIMAEALKSDVPLEQNVAFNLGFLACHERPERELLPYCRAWAADPSPLKRVAVARVLSRKIHGNESPHTETFAILSGLLDDRDPNVVALSIGIIKSMFHPAYDEALRDRRDRFAHHASAKVRQACQEQLDDEEAAAARQPAELFGEDVAGLFEATFAAMRSFDGGFEPRLEALRHRDAAERAAVAARWAQDANPDKRKLAALALEPVSQDEAPTPRVVFDALRKLSGDSDAAVAEAAVGALGALRSPGPVSGDDLATLEAGGAHPSAAARAAYVDSLAFGESPEALDALLALAGDPDVEVRAKVAMYLDNYAEGSRGKRRERMRETLAVMVSDASELVRFMAIDSLTSFNDSRAVDAIVRALEGPEANLASVCVSLLSAIQERPNSRFLPGLERAKKMFSDDDDLDEAIRACRRAKPRTPSAQERS